MYQRFDQDSHQAWPDPVQPEAPARGWAVFRETCQGRFESLRDKIEARVLKIDLAPDLAQDIGSKRWFRGFGTMLGLSLAAISFWPDLSAVEAAPAIPADQPVRDEFRSQMILPLALGADSGRHMGATPLVSPLASAPERPTIQLVATLGQGDSFTRMLQRAGVGFDDAAQVANMVANSVPLGQIAPGTQVDITLGKRSSADQPRPLDKLAFRARFDLDVNVARRDGALVLERKAIAVDATPLRIRGRVGNSLYRSARAAGAPLAAIADYLRTIDQHVSLESDISSDDMFDIVLAYKRSARGERQAGQVLYAGLESGGKPRLQLMRWGKGGQFYEADGLSNSQAARTFQPVSGRMTSRYGMRRHPILGYTRMHGGVDFAASRGSPIVAVSDGVVTYAGRHGGHGNYVSLAHANGLGSGYAHMSGFAVSSGDRVRAGQVIGYVGSTGLSTGPHLHFEIYRGGQKIDPLSVRFMSLPPISGEELARFRARLKELQAIPVGEALADIPASVSRPERATDQRPRQ